MSYPGSKAQAGVFHRIIGQMPPHSMYIEAPCGTAQVWKRKRAARWSILIDLNKSVLEPITAKHDMYYDPFSALWRMPDTGDDSLTVIRGDAIKLFPAMKLPADALIYCDPPYMLSTRAGRRYYEHEMEDSDHAALLSALVDVKCRVMISHPVTDLYLQQLQGWRCIRYQMMTRGGLKPDAIWMNYPEPSELHDWRYAGRNFRERTSLKRLAARWLAKLHNMPARKRGYVLEAIAAARADSGAAISSSIEQRRL